MQANLSSGKCIQMNVVILSNILRDAAAVAAAAADVADAAVAAAAAQDTRTTFQWQPQIVARGNGDGSLTHALEI